jgi:hypothetical protein
MVVQKLRNVEVRIGDIEEHLPMYDYRLFFPTVPADEPGDRRPFRRIRTEPRVETRPFRRPASRRDSRLAGQA